MLEAQSSFSLEIRTSRHSFGEAWWEMKLVDDRTATVQDKQCGDVSRLRRTPPGQKTVPQLVSIGDNIRTSYGSQNIGKVINVNKYSIYGLPVFTIVYVDLSAKPKKDGSYREVDMRWLNECVAQDGRVLFLFEADKEEVFVVRKAPQHNLEYYAEVVA